MQSFSRRGRPRSSRRGVLLLVVLSLLVLFMLIGTAFLMSSSQYQHSATASAKHGRLGTPPTKLLDRALMQVLCDTGNQNSVIRYHSLLRDLYGSEGFEAMVYSPIDTDIDSSENFPVGNNVGQITRYAMPTNGPSTAGTLGPTQGQLIDIYVREHAFRRDDRLIVGTEPLPGVPDARNIIKLERSALGLPEMYNMPLTKGYFNGCLLTITSGPARGQSTRIVEYDYIGDFPSNQTAPIAPAPFPNKFNTRLFRFRVMAFPRADGGPLLTRNQLPVTDSRRSTNAARGLEIADLVAAETRNAAGTQITGTTGATFIVNGRPFNGTGAGFNELAKAGEPRLDAVETVGITSSANEWLYPEIALTPNAAFFFPSDPSNPTTAAADVWGARYRLPDPAAPADPTRFTYPSLNPFSITLADRPLRWKYQSFAGPGDADESYDAPDYQNMVLAMQTVTPRSRARVVTSAGTFEVNDPAVVDGNGWFDQGNQFLRLDLEDLPLPSYFRPDLENYWFHRLALFAANPDRTSPPTTPIDDVHVRAVLQPYGVDGIRGNGDDPGVSLDIRDQLVAMKRKISLRPLREDHPNFDGSNPASRPVEFAGDLIRNGNIAVPFWEATGPWDVDNDNDGVPDSVWVDLGDPVAQAEDGTLYKPLYAFLIVDLDSRLNVNAHGLVDDVLRNPVNRAFPPNLDPLGNSLANFASSNLLPHGLGYGPAEISLRPLLSPNLPGSATLATNVGATNILNADDYARILVGRPGSGTSGPVWGRHGLDVNPDLTVMIPYKVAPGITSTSMAYAQPGPPGIQTQFKFFGYPWMLSNYAPGTAIPSLFSTAPDMMGRYSLGLDHAGQPVNEMRNETANQPLLADSPYELDLSGDRRRDVRTDGLTMRLNVTTGATEYYVPGTTTPTRATTGVAKESDDAPFATADLERILRAHDADSGILPDRLWNVVDAFDPLKLLANQPAAVLTQARQTFGNNPGDAALLATAQQLAGVNRRLTTTDSYDLPVPGATLLARLTYGADGQPGVAGQDDDGLKGTDDPAELGWQNSDDYYAVMNRGTAGAHLGSGAPTPLAGVVLVPDHPTLVDLLKYRIQFERWKQGAPKFTEPQLSQAVAYLLPPEIIAGKRMDLNRPFGDGRDNGDGIDNDGVNGIDDPGEMNYPVGDSNRDPYLNGIVDEPEEGGEPFVDRNDSRNGRYDVGEDYRDLDGDGQYTPPRDQLWQGLVGEPIGFDYNHGGDVTDGRKIDTNGDGDYDDPEDGVLRNNGIQQRQTYARQLYCLMMLLMDESYFDSQNFFPDGDYDLTFLNEKGNFDLFLLHQNLAVDMALRKLRADGAFDETTDRTTQAFQTMLGDAINDAKPAAYLWVMRKLTARKVAQWAINCVDFRDADSIMTPFEYDENPWDGWGVYYDPTQPFSTANFIPLDGDVGTNENWGKDVPAPRKFNPYLAITVNGGTNDDNDVPLANADLSGREQATREVVWGAERPELLITETLALHDRRCTDEDDPAGYPPHHKIGNPPANPTAANPPDFDLDQKLKPRGSLFVELYNPWSADTHRPAELYGATPNSAGQQGVMLNELSARADSATGKRSPVWRMAVLNEPFSGKLSNQVIDPRQPPSGTFPSPVEQAARQVLTTDPDGFAIEMDRDAERFVYFTTGGDMNRQDDNDLVFDLTGGTGDYEKVGAVYSPIVNQLSVRVPPLYIPKDLYTGEPTRVDPTDSKVIPSARRYFIARTERAGTLPNDIDVPIAPILPGHYAVIGSSGLQLTGNGVSGQNTPGAGDSDVTTRFVTPISRLTISETASDPNLSQRTNLFQSRRIELWPSDDPTKQQLLIGENGGNEFVSTTAGMVNVTDTTSPQNPGDGVPDVPLVGDANLDGTPDTPIIDPCVAIPVEDLSVSEPVEGYPSLMYRKLYAVNATNASGQLSSEPEKVIVTPDGELEFEHSFDHPMDLDPELVKNGTTQNYRTLHLQRLANPSLPWNPPPFDTDGVENKMHQPGLPVNPYLSVDSQSVDLTAYNGASQLERSELPVIPNPPPANMAFGDEDYSQGNFLGPLTPEELADAPDHVLWAYIFMLKQEIPGDNGVLQPSILPKLRWITPADLRGQIENQPDQIRQQLEQLFVNKRVSSADEARRQTMVNPHPDDYGRPWNAPWSWSRFRRVLPDDAASDNSSKTGSFVQWMHMKSLERGAQDSAYYSNQVPYSAFYKKYLDGGFANQAPKGWAFDASWTPRLLWQQTRPNSRLFLRSSTGVVEASDLKNVYSRRQLHSTTPNEELTDEEMWMSIPDDELRRNEAIWDRLHAGSGPGGNEHIVDYVLEQTLGFANQAYAPNMDRTNGREVNAILSVQKPGAPEIARVGTAFAPAATVNDPVAKLYPDNRPYDVANVGSNIPKEILNAPRKGSLIQSLADIIVSGAPAQLKTLAREDKEKLERDFYERRNRLMRSTYPWLAWGDRPFVSAAELTQVPASSSSQLLKDYSVVNPTSPNPYDGTIADDGTLNILSEGVLIGSDPDGIRNTAYRFARQNSPFGHLLNFFATAIRPSIATIDVDSAALFGAAKYYRILDFVEVPSRYVGTETMLSPEIFNDVPGLDDGTAAGTVGSNISGPGDPRFNLQPPFNTVSRQRDPGRVNLNTVTGRRAAATASTPPFIWSEVFDGIMHRYPKYDPATGQMIRADGNLLDDFGNLLQLGHFGPAWRDVVLSRRGYAQYNADPAVGNPIEKLATTQIPPEAFAFGLNKEFPSLFSNPFRSADAGDLVPLPNMVRPGVEATWLRGHHWQRAQEDLLKTNPFAASSNQYEQIAWGIAGQDDDLNGIVDDVREAGFGEIDATNGIDGDSLRVNSTTQALESSGIPLFSEEVPEPAIDGERNPGMMYQPMTRLGNLVTTRSNVYAIWVTVGYFEVEKAPDWNANENNVRQRFGAGSATSDTDAAWIRARALYDRVYPDGYMLGEELGTDTGNTNRQRAFYIIDRTEPVGFKPGEDLNVDKMIRVRRRIE